MKLPHLFSGPLETAVNPPGTMVDPHGRRITYLRLSVTDRCDFRCRYCMTDKVRFLPHDALMTLEECERLVRAFVGLGVTKLRITGGEPLVRRNLTALLRELARIPGLKDLVLTTNGSQLARHADDLRAAGVKRLNVSLDTLDPARFRQITRTGELAPVLAGIAAARRAGFTRLKLNTVMMRGVNDDELVRLAEYAVAEGHDIAFIEEMPIGPIGERNGRYLSSDEALPRLAARFSLTPSAESTGGPARYLRIDGSTSRLGFISPHTHNFCDTCNRVRVSARGELHPCLGHDDALPLLPLLRDPQADDAALQAAIVRALGRKPAGHAFAHGASQPMRFMSMSGG